MINKQLKLEEEKKRKALKEIEKKGGTALYVKTDVAREEDIDNLVVRHRAEL